MRRALLHPMVLGAALLVGGSPALAAELLPEKAKIIDIDKKFGALPDPTLPFTDHRGQTVRIGDFFDGRRPVLMTLNWYNCGTLCSTQLNQLLEALRTLDWTAGNEFRMVTVSIDPREDWTLARDKRASYLQALGRGEDVDWSFLVGAPGEIRKLTDEMGFRYAYDREQDQFLHTTVVYVMTPQGAISHYLFGITYEPRDLKFSLIEASQGRLGSAFDKLLLSCFHYDETLGRFAATGLDVMRFFGILTVLVLGSALLVFWLVDRQKGHKPLEVSP